jgi:hypothetical protein
MATGEQGAAYDKVRHAVRTGKLVKPDICEKCGCTPPRRRDGRSLIQGHHHRGYSRPLDVRWLCHSCHDETIDHPRGIKNGASKLTRAQAVEIKRLALSRRMSGPKIAERFGVTHHLVYMIRDGLKWPDL